MHIYIVCIIPSICTVLILCFRSTHDVVVLDGCIYAIGGNDGSTSLNSMERYNPKANKWVLVAPMTMRRSSVAVAVLDMAKHKAAWNTTACQ